MDGGTVKLIILDSSYNIASSVLIENVQNIICPSNLDKGLGIAPIGHKVTIATPTSQEINIKTKVTLANGVTLSNVQEIIEDAVSEYLLGLRISWEYSESVIVRISQIESKILNIEGIVDVVETTINNQASNLEILSEKVPTLGNVEVQEYETN